MEQFNINAMRQVHQAMLTESANSRRSSAVVKPSGHFFRKMWNTLAGQK
ncbi:hypothetical protein [Alicyclobacillus fastidiosus]|uniref:Uncharacterized protein n=1 Tax=Alicyclobacillus fastidiosus TaxID=392011 RepID=A0ABV5A9M4_9BACL|nr:hypothetical protein [Alicyclobacillus fastidiosus]WEH10892.1 hypothetical protein PYS47_06655 [Alicyclobacillus fastidiosus]